MTFLFDSTIFGPVKSRRLGNSLGINLLPNNRKVCNYNCIYCECGLTNNFNPEQEKLPTRKYVYHQLEDFLIQAIKDNTKIDTITFAGNGEPCLHPEFHNIIKDVRQLRDSYFPRSKIAVLSNATLLDRPKIVKSLQLADLNILKLDSAIEETIEIINCPNQKISAAKLIQQLKAFQGKLIIQTLFLKGSYYRKKVDNTTETEVNAWLAALQEIQPQQVMIYTFSRSTPYPTLEKISEQKLNEIGNLVKKTGLNCIISA